MEELQRNRNERTGGNVPAPRCENDAAPHVAASGVNGEDDNCGGGDDVHGERELGRKAAREGGRLRAAVLQSQWRWWRQRRGKTVGLEKREDEQTVSFNYESIGGGRSVGRTDRLLRPSVQMDTA